MNDASLIFSFMLWALILIAYIMPAAIASHRKCKATAAIAIVNVFLGWTFIGWVVALAWAVSGEKSTTPREPLFRVTHGDYQGRALTEEEMRLGRILLSGANLSSPQKPPAA